MYELRLLFLPLVKKSEERSLTLAEVIFIEWEYTVSGTWMFERKKLH